MEGLGAPPMRTGSMPFSEYLLQGSILEIHRDSLLHRLNGLCDPIYTGPEKFHDHEMVHQIGGNATLPPITFRVRRAIDHPDAPWHMRYVGAPDLTGDKSRHTMIRSWLEAGTSSNVDQFLQEMGFRLDHEYILKGYFFRKGRMKVTVSKIFRMLESGNVDNIEPLSNSYLVELSVVAPYGQDAVQEDMKNFAEQLKPLVQLEKDHRKIQQQLQAQRS